MSTKIVLLTKRELLAEADGWLLCESAFGDHESRLVIAAQRSGQTCRAEGVAWLMRVAKLPQRKGLLADVVLAEMSATGLIDVAQMSGKGAR